MVRALRNCALLIASVACAAPDSAGKIEGRESELRDAHKIAACAAALDAVSIEAEKRYRAVLIAPKLGARRGDLPEESASARQALTELELALVRAPAEASLDRTATRFAFAAEALLLRAREPARFSGDGALQQTASLHALLATHELFEDAAARLRLEVEQAVRSRTLIEAMRRDRERPSSVR